MGFDGSSKATKNVLNTSPVVGKSLSQLSHLDIETNESNQPATHSTNLDFEFAPGYLGMNSRKY
jgi:hypothetical protein